MGRAMEREASSPQPLPDEKAPRLHKNHPDHLQAMPEFSSGSCAGSFPNTNNCSTKSSKFHAIKKGRNHLAWKFLTAGVISLWLYRNLVFPWITGFELNVASGNP